MDMSNSPRAVLELQENRRLVAQIAHTRVKPNTAIMPPPLLYSTAPAGQQMQKQKHVEIRWSCSRF